MASSTHFACFLCSLLTHLSFFLHQNPMVTCLQFTQSSALKQILSFLQLQGTYAYGLLVEISLASKIQSQTYSAKGLSLS